MATLPPATRFPSFKDTCTHLQEESLQCTWYLPKEGRLCRCKITLDDAHSALELSESIKKTGLTVDQRVEMLQDIAELSCCPRHHRSKIYGTDLGKEVAQIWYGEMKLASVPSIQTHPRPPTLPRRVFAKHQVHTTESMGERIRSTLDLDQGSSGSIYFYTHAASAFAGMVKIGYTCRSVASRLYAWEECGHGAPKLLDSIVDVRHPGRVELLTHFELIELWHELMWCKAHGRTHIEWFRTDVHRAKAIAERWNKWMHGANPYDRRGKLKPLWEERCRLLQERGRPITARTMLVWHEMDMAKFVDDAEPSKNKSATAKVTVAEIKVKKEEEPDQPSPAAPQESKARRKKEKEKTDRCIRYLTRHDVFCVVVRLQINMELRQEGW
ncbi:hypothetical protein NLU13_1863 [Sarocladium strictum]|uniref:Bacteriophage T5 Orf172 DNA-binding domain-containing protein n=1 Tax=Sarocladium strictum TaxID=5046 RepID=A0AA39GTB6_SARSR|nr:hypothetical protein NLU13_1863 [Sarocladium strictum]